METEVCAYSLESCRAAREGGATRVELCAGPPEGGTTPSAGTIIQARKISGLEMSVMIRPRGGDFLYSKEEYEQMKADLDFVRSTGADGIVIGLLTRDGDVDKERTREMVSLAGGMEVTFHRAFDMVRSWNEALEDIIECGCTRVLTSGGCNTAFEGRTLLQKIVGQAGGRLEIMAGSGINPGNAAILAATGVDALHFSARAVRDSGMVFRNPRVSMGGIPGMMEYDIAYADPRVIASIVEQVGRL